jgi:hypothetical protein
MVVCILKKQTLVSSLEKKKRERERAHMAQANDRKENIHRIILLLLYIIPNV